MAKPDKFIEQMKASLARAVSADAHDRMEGAQRGVSTEPTVLTVSTEPTLRSAHEPTSRNEPTDTTEPTYANPLMKLAPSRIVFLEYVLKNRARMDREYTPWGRVVKETGLSLISIKRLTKDLMQRGVIRVEFDEAHRQGSRVYLAEAYVPLLTRLLGEPTYRNEPTVSTEPTYGVSTAPTVSTEPTLGTPLDRLERFRKVYLSQTEEDMDTWQNLLTIGVTENELADALADREAGGVSEATFLEDLFILDHNFGKPDLVSATIKKNKLAYFRRSIRNGSATATEGYVSPLDAKREALRAKWAVADARRQQEADDQDEEAFQAWASNLSAERIEQIVESGIRQVPKCVRLYNAWCEETGQTI